MACWLACVRLGRAPPAELDEMMADALEREALSPLAFGVRWESVEDLFPGRPCPTHVLARASIAIATQGPGR